MTVFFLVNVAGLMFCVHQLGLLNRVNLILKIVLHFGQSVVLKLLLTQPHAEVLLHELIKLHGHPLHLYEHQLHLYELQKL